MVGIHWNTSLFLGWPIFRGYVRFREGTVMFPLKALNIICFLRINSRFDYTAHLTLFAASPCQTFPFVLFCTTISIYFLWWPISYLNLPTTTHTKGDFFGDSSSSSRGTKIFKSEDQILSKKPGIFWGIAKHHRSEGSLTKKQFSWGGVGFLFGQMTDSKVRGGSKLTEIFGNLSEGIVMKKPTAMSHTFRSFCFFLGGFWC